MKALQKWSKARVYCATCLTADARFSRVKVARVGMRSDTAAWQPEFDYSGVFFTFGIKSRNGTRSHESHDPSKRFLCDKWDAAERKWNIRRVRAINRRGGIIATPLQRSYLASWCFAHGRRRSARLRGRPGSASTLVCLFPTAAGCLTSAGLPLQ